MSGFLVSRRQDADRRGVARRGRDLHRELSREGHFFFQAETRAGGDLEPRPFAEDEVVAVFDGEIYGRPAGVGVAEHVIALYREHCEDFARHLDGDFAVAIYDFGRRILLLATDGFATKPIFLDGTQCASYPSGLGGRGDRVAPNSLVLVDLDSGARETRAILPFDFASQHKESYEDVLEAFEQAVGRRAREGCYLPLSAGYDSGAIACALEKLGIGYRPYSIVGEENLDLLRRRNRHGVILDEDPAVYAKHKVFLSRYREPAGFHMKIVNDEGEERIYDVLEDNASSGLSLIHQLAAAEGRRLSLSGTGAEIFSAHRAGWPAKLRPWQDFDGRMAAAYLAKEEFAAGVYGAEVRYPFLDRRLVQEFLWLTPEAKGRFYKAPLHEYTRRSGYPFDLGVKTGFIPICEQ